MVIRPRAPISPTTPSVRTSLGRVSVTIDDLQALLDLLNGRDEIPDEVVVQCDEGDFTEAEDMRKLGDRTLQDLRIEVPGLVVHLASTRAEAVGKPELATLVARAWARPRQTSAVPLGTKWYARPWLFWISLPVGLAILTVATTLAFRYPDIDDRLGILLFTLPMGLGILLLFHSLFVRLNFRGRAFAVANPKTYDEIRDLKAGKTYVPLWSLLVSILLFVVSLTFNILNFAWPRS